MMAVPIPLRAKYRDGFPGRRGSHATATPNQLKATRRKQRNQQQRQAELDAAAAAGTTVFELLCRQAREAAEIRRNLQLLKRYLW